MSSRRTAFVRFLGLALVCAGLALPSCGRSNVVPTPLPTVEPTPTPTPTPVPTPVTSCSPLPVPVTRWQVKVMFRGRYWTVDATPLVGPNVDYCASVGFTLGTSICPVRPEGDPMRNECENYAVGKAKDTGRFGPTWRRNGQLCMGETVNGCENSADNQYQVWAYWGGIYEACATNGACSELEVDR